MVTRAGLSSRSTGTTAIWRVAPRGAGALAALPRPTLGPCLAHPFRECSCRPPWRRSRRLRFSPRVRGDDIGGGRALARAARSTLARKEVAAARIGDGAYAVGGFRSRRERRPMSSSATTCAVIGGRASTDPAGRRPRGRRRYRGALTRRRLHEPFSLRRRERSHATSRPPTAGPRCRTRRRRAARSSPASSATGSTSPEAPRRKALTTLEIYDFSRRTWTTGPAMRVAREHLAGTCSAARSTPSQAARRSAEAPVVERTSRRAGAGSAADRCARRAVGSPRRPSTPYRRGRWGGVRGHDRRGRVV